MLALGAEALTDAELIAILIGSGSPKESAVTLAQKILWAVDNNLNTLAKFTVKELADRFKGIGPAKAVAIRAALELGKRRSATAPAERPLIREEPARQLPTCGLSLRRRSTPWPRDSSSATTTRRATHGPARPTTS